MGVGLQFWFLCARLGSGADSGEAPAPPDRGGKVVLAESALEGERDLKKAASVLRSVVVSQPYGRTWSELVKVDKAPKDGTGLGQAATHPALKNDPMEMQQQAQHLEETGVEVRYGFVSIRGVRVFRYGKLRATQLVVEPIGKGEGDAFRRDVEAIALAWADLLSTLELGAAFEIVRNDFVQPKAMRVPPLRVELQPVKRGRD